MSNSTAPTPLRLDQQIDAQLVRITPSLAEEWLGRNESNRNIRPSKVAQLVRDMKAGNFVLSGDSIRFDHNGNLIDGQHRLTAIRDSGVEVYSLVVHGLNPTVRAVIDTGTRRSAADALRMAGKNAASRSMAATIRLLLGIQSGVVVRAGDAPPDVTHSEVVEFYDAHYEILDYAIAFSNRHHKSMHARPSALAAAMFIGAQRDLSQFTAFIVDVTELNFSGTGNPGRTLYKRLQSLRDEQHQNSEEVYFILRAFEARLAGQSLAQMKSATGNGRAVISTRGWLKTAA